MVTKVRINLKDFIELLEPLYRLGAQINKRILKITEEDREPTDAQINTVKNLLDLFFRLHRLLKQIVRQLA